MKRRNKKKEKKEMLRLIELAKKTALTPIERYSHRYIELAKKISIKNRIPFPKEGKILYCKNCKSFIYPGKTSRVRIRDGKIKYYCKNCKTFRRISYK